MSKNEYFCLSYDLRFSELTCFMVARCNMSGDYCDNCYARVAVSELPEDYIEEHLDDHDGHDLFPIWTPRAERTLYSRGRTDSLRQVAGPGSFSAGPPPGPGIREPGACCQGPWELPKA